MTWRFNSREQLAPTFVEGIHGTGVAFGLGVSQEFSHLQMRRVSLEGNRKRTT